MRGPRIPRLLGFQDYLNNCFAYCCTSMLFSNLGGPRIPRLRGFKNYLNNCFAYCCTSMLFSNMRETRIPWFFGWLILGHLCYSLIYVDLVSPGYLSLKII